MEKQDKQIPVTAAIYARLTSDQSVEQQIEQCRQQASQDKVEVDDNHLYIDRSDSAKDSKTRPGLLELLKNIEQGNFPSLLYAGQDRHLFRTEKEASFWSHWIWEHQIEIRLCQLDPDSTWISTRTAQLIATNKSRRQAVKKSRQMALNSQRGFHNGGWPPFGYSTQKVELELGDDKDQDLGLEIRTVYLLDKETAPIARQIFFRYLDGDRISDIKRYLDQQGYPSSTDRVRDILDICPFYVGDYDRQGNQVDFPHPAIIDQYMSDQVQRLRKEQSDRHRAHNRQQYPLTGLIYCHHCNGRYRGRTTHVKRKYRYRKATTYPFYRCSRRIESFRSCDSSPSIRADKLNLQVMEQLNQYFSDTPLAEQYFQLACQEYNQILEDNQPKIDKIETESELTEQKMTNLILLMADHSLPHEQVRTALKQEQKKKQYLNQILKSQPQPFKPTSEDFNTFQQQLNQIMDDVSNLTLVAPALIEKITVLSPHQVQIKLKLEEDA